VINYGTPKRVPKRAPRKVRSRVNRVVPSEHAEQVRFVQFVRARYSWFFQFLTAVPNGGYRAMKTARALQLEGVSPGFPDLFLAYPLGQYAGLMIEMKRSKQGRTSPEQADWYTRLNHAGYAAHICAGADAAIQVFEEYVRGAPLRPE
jgi:hypothetical protein